MEARSLSRLARLAAVGVALSLTACGARTSLRDDLPDAATVDASTVDAAAALDVAPLPDVPSIPDLPPAPDVPSVPDVPIPMDVVQLAAGGSHTCALRSSGTVLCWGSNRVGQLGDGTMGPRRPEPRVVEGVADAVFITAGEEHTCAVRRDGAVLCWGLGTHGELGDGRRVSRATPGPVRGLGEAVQVAGGHNHTCARLRSGEVSCWGSNTSGELGDDASGNDRVVPVMAVGVTDAVQVVAGFSHSCARLTSGRVLCWGRNFESQLGDGTSGNFMRFMATPVRGLDDAAELTSGQFHTCARRSTGTVVCWGSNTNGQVGDGSRSQRAAPVGVRSIVDAAGLAAGSNHTCARLMGGQVVCWGSNGLGQIGDGSRTDELLPTRTLNLPDAREVVAGLNHTCARRTNGQVLCWGFNDQGQIGDGTTERRLVPTPVVGL
jgi:alpha-tubulin suppressor-like RCC1 family protein